jgi:hypothetical protein
LARGFKLQFQYSINGEYILSHLLFFNQREFQVVKNVASQSLEVKKLVYLYLLHYAEKYVSNQFLFLLCFMLLTSEDLRDVWPSNEGVGIHDRSGRGPDGGFVGECDAVGVLNESNSATVGYKRERGNTGARCSGLSYCKLAGNVCVFPHGVSSLLN